MTQDANEPTGKAPNAPMQDRMAKARAAKAKKADSIGALRAEVERLARLVQAQHEGASDEVAETPRPGEYFVAGVDAGTGKPVYRKRKWTRADIERLYPKATFAPSLTTPVRPHGINYELTAGEIVTVPSIVKDLHDAMVFAIRRQSEGYRVSAEAASRVFEAAIADTSKGRHFEPLKHVGYGWDQTALTAVSKGLGDDPKEMERVGWEPEVGFPGGYEGKPLPEVKA